MEEFVKKIVNLQRYVPYSKEEKEKIKCFISYLPQIYQDKLEFYNPTTTDETIRKVKLCYNQLKYRNEINKSWQARKKEKIEHRKKGFKPSPFRKVARRFQGTNYNQYSN